MTDHVWSHEDDAEWADRFTLEAARRPAVRHTDIVAWLDAPRDRRLAAPRP